MKKIITTIYCDRCGKEVEDIKNRQGLCTYGFQLKKSRNFIEKIYYGDAIKLDLCQSCYDSFAKWMEDKR